MGLASVAALLKTYGYEVLTASSGSDAIATAEIHLDNIALLLTDVSMPEMPGQQLARELTNRRPELKVLFTSGYGEGVLDSVADETIEFLQKPATAGELSRRIREVLDK